MTYYSECCNEPMPDYPDSDFCPKCGEHSGPMKEEKKGCGDRLVVGMTVVTCGENDYLCDKCEEYYRLARKPHVMSVHTTYIGKLKKVNDE